MICGVMIMSLFPPTCVCIRYRFDPVSCPLVLHYRPPTFVFAPCTFRVLVPVRGWCDVVRGVFAPAITRRHCESRPPIYMSERRGAFPTPKEHAAALRVADRRDGRGRAGCAFGAVEGRCAEKK